MKYTTYFKVNQTEDKFVYVITSDCIFKHTKFMYFKVFWK